MQYSAEEIAPWAEFGELPDKKFTDFGEVRETIGLLTDKVCGKNANINDKPIVLHVTSHTCPNLMLVDLPGLTRFPMAGQPDNIEQITKSMAARYCQDSRTIILCVLPANVDCVCGDALQMARRLDPAGTRTIGVITKIDAMDRGTNAKRMLEGKEVPFRIGYVGVKNRSQQGILDGIPVKAAIEAEQMFFSSHPIYSTMPP